MVTTIAYRDGILAVDSQVSDGNRFDGTMKKWARGDGWIAAMAGAANRFQVMETLCVTATGYPVFDKSMLSDSEELIVVTSLGLFFCNSNGYFQMQAPFYVSGSGGSIAMGAMAHGATAEEAVQIACKYDTKTCEPVHVLRVND